MPSDHLDPRSTAERKQQSLSTDAEVIAHLFEVTASHCVATRKSPDEITQFLALLIAETADLITEEIKDQQ